MVDSPDRNDNLLRPSDFIDVLGSGWPFRAITVIPYALVTLLPTTASELGRLEVRSLPVAIGVAALSVSILATLVALVGLWLPARLRKSSGWVILALVAAGALRGIIVSSVVSSMGIESHSHLPSRIVLGALSLPPVLGLVSLVISRIVTAREMSASTRAEINVTERTRDRILGDVNSSDTRLVEEVDETLRPAVASILADVRGGISSRSELADSIDRLANDVIRPLSHTLASAGTAFSEVRGPVSRTLAAPGIPTVREQFNPLFSGLGIFLGSGTVLVDLVPFGSAFIAAATAGLFAYGVLKLLSLVIGERRWSFLRTAVLITAVYSVIWIPAHLFNQTVVFPAGFNFQPWVVSVIATPLLGLLYQLIVRGAYVSRNNLVRLDNARIDMLIQLSEARRRAWLRQRHLTHTLHSAVQSRVHAEARVIRSGTGTLSVRERDQASEVVESVLDVVRREPPVFIDALGGIRDIIEFWAGMCTITLAADSDSEKTATSDPEVAEAMHIVTLEMISNAIRHGHATQIDITMSRTSRETITITAINNGTRMSEQPQVGLGMALYDELAAQWSIDNGDAVTATAVVAARER